MTKRSRRCGVRLEILDELEQAPLEIAVRRPLQLLAGAHERFAEALAVEWLEQVVERMDVERRATRSDRRR